MNPIAPSIPNRPQRVALLGATGSIGDSTLQVLRLHPERYQIWALSGHQRLDRLADLTRQYQPQYVIVPHGQGDVFQHHLSQRPPALAPIILEGDDGLIAAATAPDVDVVMAAIVGAAGLPSTLAAVQAGKRVLLANKEALVMAGDLMIEAMRASGATLLPVDSEHNAIFQCLPPDYFVNPSASNQVMHLLLTASGGPFRGWTRGQLERVTPEQACQHPTWVMGQKITVDSATLMNKGLELIEACYLFQTPPERVRVVLHPQSVIHSLVQYVDGSVLAQLGQPDMRTPIAHALAWPTRIDSGVTPLDLIAIGRLEFEEPDEDTFVCLKLARQAIQQGGIAPTVLNAANEITVEAFLQGRIGFNQIGHINDQVLQSMPWQPVNALDEVLVANAQARAYTRQLIQALP